MHESDYHLAPGYNEAPMQERQRANDARIGGAGMNAVKMPMPETRASNLADRINESERRIEQLQASINKMYEELTSACANLQNQIHELNQFVGRRG